MSVDAARVKELRERTGAGVLACREALVSAQGDLEQAVRILREKGLAAAAKKADRVAKDGLIHAYIHPGGRLGVLVEVNCETDFVARTDDFKALAHQIALQIAGTDPPPRYVSRAEIPADEAGQQPGGLDAYAAKACLLEQPFVKNTAVRVQDLLTETIAKVGENIAIRRFSRFQIGDA